jgi:hypothetical protein
VDVSALAFMDDTTLLSSSKEGLIESLSVVQEFSSFNNTKINFDKAVFVCNRDPSNPVLPFPKERSPINLCGRNFDFNITPSSPEDSFRFLGVWFNLNLNTSYVKRQCASEYRLFCKTLYRKRLTDKQLSYLHNSVLLPKVEYRLKATVLTEEACDIIFRPFKRLFKHALQLVSTFPTDILQYKQATNIFNLYH